MVLTESNCKKQLVFNKRCETLPEKLIFASFIYIILYIVVDRKKVN